MATTFRASASAAGNSTAPSVTKPTGTVDGDIVLWAVYTVQAAPTVTPPAGFVLVRAANNSSGGKLSVYQKAALSDGASYTGAISSSGDWICGAFTAQGTSPGAAQSAGGANGLPASKNCVVPAVLTLFANSCVVIFQLQDLGFATTWTADAATTETFDLNDSSSQATLCCDYANEGGIATYGPWTVVNDTVNIGLNNGTYLTVELADNSAPGASVNPVMPVIGLPTLRARGIIQRLGWVTTSFLAPLETQNVDKWRGFSDPVPSGRRYPTREGMITVDPSALVRDDSTQRGTAMYSPVPGRRRVPVREGIFSIDPYSLSDEPHIGQWSAFYQPRISPKRAAFWRGLFVVDPPTAEPSTQIGHAYYEPVPKPRRAAFWRGWYTVDPQALRRDIDPSGWLGYHQPVANKRRDIRPRLGLWAGDWTSTMFSPPFVGNSKVVDYPEYTSSVVVPVYEDDLPYLMYDAVRTLTGDQ